MKQQKLFPTTQTPKYITQLPQWMRVKLKTINSKNPNPYNEKLFITECDNCKNLVLQGGINEQTCENFTLEPTFINSQIELACIIIKRQTVTIWYFDYLRASTRGVSSLKHFFPNFDREAMFYVATTHLCGLPLGEPLPWDKIFTKPPPEPDDDKPPF